MNPVDNGAIEATIMAVIATAMVVTGVEMKIMMSVG